jgi:hypothetical protein
MRRERMVGAMSALPVGGSCWAKGQGNASNAHDGFWPKAAVIGIRPVRQLSGDKPLSTPLKQHGRI